MPMRNVKKVLDWAISRQDSNRVGLIDYRLKCR